MPTIIDSLIVTLGLDSSDYDANKKKVDSGLNQSGEVADKTGKKVAKSGKDGAKGFQELTRAAVGFMAILGGATALKRFIEDTISANAALDRLSKNLGTSVQTVSAWSNAAELAGGSASGMQATLDQLSKAQTEIATTGTTNMLQYLSALGVSLFDAAGQAKPLDNILLELSERFETMDRTKANNFGRMMGLDQDTLQLLLKGRKEVELMILKQKEYGAVSKKQAEEASRLSRAITEGKQAFSAFGRELLSAATPALETIFKMFSDFGDWIKENQEFVQAFLTILAAGLVAIGVAATPVNLVIIAVTALAAAIAALYQDYLVWKRGGESFIDWDKWEPGLTAAGNGIRWLKDLLEDMIYRAIAGADVLSAVFDRDWERVKFAASEFVSGTRKVYGEDRYEGQAARPPAPTSVVKTQPVVNAPQPPAPSTLPTTVRTLGLKTIGDVSADYGRLAPGGKAQPRAEDREKFIDEAARRLNVPRVVVDAHLRSETGVTGKSTIGEFNYGNIKTGRSWQGESVTKNVPEYDANGKEFRDNAAFRSYKSPEEAAADYAKLIEKRFPKAVGATNATDYATGLKAGGYATDPNYVQKITNISRSIERKQAQTPPVLNGIPNATQSAKGATPETSFDLQKKPESKGNTVSNDTKIGEIKIYTSATDANGIAKDMGNELNYLFTSDANYGLS